MNNENKILVTGGSGLVGKYLKKILPDAVYISSKDYDLTTENGVQKMFLKFSFLFLLYPSNLSIAIKPINACKSVALKLNPGK